VKLLVFYDFQSDRLRRRAADACLDFGLERIQYSVFMGPTNADWRGELEERLSALVDDGRGRVDVVALPQNVARDMSRFSSGTW